MKVIYLDIDGVLNCATTTEKVAGVAGVESEKLRLLNNIVKETNGKIVLISTWKEGWVRDKKFKPFQSLFARYLDEQFYKAKLTIYDKTSGGVYARSEGILDYNLNCGVKKFVILDDTYADYDGYGLTDNLIKTDARVGLDAEKVRQAVDLLNKP